MMNAYKGFRRAPGNFLRAHAAACGAGLIVTTTSAILWADPAMAADDPGSRPAAPAAGHVLAAGSSTDHVLAAQVLIIVAVGTLTFALTRLRRVGGRQRAERQGGGRQGAAHARGPRRAGGLIGPGGDPWIGRPAPPGPGADQPLHQQPQHQQPQHQQPLHQQPVHHDDYPSWPGRPGPYALHPDHPSWPGRPDPRWANTEAALRADGYPSWPESQAPPGHETEPPPTNNGPGRHGRGSPVARREPPPPPRHGQGPQRPPATVLAAPVLPAPVLPARVRTGPIPRLVDMAPRPGPMLQERPAVLIDLVRPEDDRRAGPAQVWDGGSAQLASWILTEANQQAAEIRHEARDQATTSLTDAKQEAAELIRQAATKLEAAELQAAQITAAVVKLSADLGGMAAYVAENLLAPPATKPAVRPAPEPLGIPVAEPQAQPEALPEAQPQARPAATPTAKPGTRPQATPAGRPGTGPAAQPGAKPAAGKATGKNRQRAAIRVMAAVTAALVLFAVICGTTEVALHGFRFFVFRSVGTGETGQNGLTESQGPGQPDAPGAHK
jgi:hypothetical protein